MKSGNINDAPMSAVTEQDKSVYLCSGTSLSTHICSVLLHTPPLKLQIDSSKFKVSCRDSIKIVI